MHHVDGPLGEAVEQGSVPSRAIPRQRQAPTSERVDAAVATPIAPTTEAVPLEPIRLQSLDGLRGVAALMVMTHHVMLTWPAMAQPLWTPDWRPGDGIFSRAFASPLHPLLDGAHWVHVFFVMSAIVLTLPVVHPGKVFRWTAYYPRRLIRIYVPTIAAVLLALAWFLAVDRSHMHSPFFTWDHGSMRFHGSDFPRLHHVLDDMLLFGRPGHIDIPLWSLRFEIYFSMLLPIAIWLGVKMQRFFVPVILLCLAIISASASVGFGYGMLMPLFGIGVLMACRFHTLRSWGEAINRHPRAKTVWAVLLTTGFLLLGSHWTVLSLGGNAVTKGWLQGASDLGVLILIFGALFCPFIVSLLSLGPIQYVGQMAFSMYLVHEPVVTGVAALFGEGRQLWAAIISVPLAFVLVRIFYLLIERPSTKWSRNAARRINQRAANPQRT